MHTFLYEVGRYDSKQSIILESMMVIGILWHWKMKLGKLRGGSKNSLLRKYQ
jgi:hypothetical protein